MKSVFCALLAGMILLYGCRTMEPEPSLPGPVVVPDQYSVDIEGSASADQWWTFLESNELDRLIQEALTKNFDLLVLQSRVDQAKARVEKQSADLFPSLSFSAGGQKRATQVKSSHSSSTVSNTGNSWDTSLNGSYTMDVWGREKAQVQAQVLDLEAAGKDLQKTRNDVSEQVAQTWIDIIAARKRLAVLENQIHINKTLLDLQKLRFVNGKASALDVSQQREVLAEASSQVPLIEKQEQLLLNTLAFLIGKPHAQKIQVHSQNLPEPPPLPDIGLPARLLKNRPDIQAAKMRLISSQWDVKAAEADLLPSFKLSAQALFSSGKLDLLFQNWIATLAASISGPIFDGGYRKAEIKRVKAIAEEAISLYAKTVANAIREVENSLTGIQKQEDYIRLLEEELELTRLTLQDARLQYQNGQSSYLSYLVAWTSIERLERQLIGERAEYIKERIGLYQSLGWQTNIKPDES